MSKLIDELLDKMELYSGAVVQIASDITGFAYQYYLEEKRPLDINQILDGII